MYPPDIKLGEFGFVIYDIIFAEHFLKVALKYVPAGQFVQTLVSALNTNGAVHWMQAVPLEYGKSTGHT